LRVETPQATAFNVWWSSGSRFAAKAKLGSSISWGMSRSLLIFSERRLRF
jgi:hypothetical protein